MPGIPVICEHCRKLFASRLLNPSGTVTNLTLGGNSEPCPHCGKQTGLLEGLFNYRDGTLELIDGPQVTVDSLKKIQQIIAAAEQDATEESIETQIEQETGQRQFIQRIATWANHAGYAIDAVDNWKGRLIFVAWIIREILGVVGDK